MEPDLKLTDVEELVLLCVSRLGGDANGLLIRQALKEVARRQVPIGAIYSSLTRLEQREMVSSRPGAPSSLRGGQAQTYYTLEETGELALAEADALRGRLRTRLRPGWEPAGEIDGRSS